MTDFFRFLLLGVGPGALYALLAVGVVLVYRGSGVVNFGAGGFALFGSAIYFELHDVATKGGAVAIAVVASAMLGVLVHTVIIEPMRSASPLARVVATLGVTVALELAAKWKYGTTSRFVESFLPTDGVHLGSVVVGADRLYVLAITTALAAGLWVVYRRTPFGIATTAVAENPRATACLGWSPSRIAAINWALGGALAGLAGALLVPILGFSPTAFTLLIVPALAVALLAGFRSFPLALAGGLVVGILESEGTLLHSKHPEPLLGIVPTFGLASFVPFLVIIAVMIVRGRAIPLRGELTDHLPRLGTGVPRWRVVLVVVVLACGSAWAFTPSWVAALSISATVALVGMSVVVLTGYAGQLSLAQFALAGIGALVSSRLADAGGVPFLAAAALGMIAAVAVGLLVALPAVRVRGVNLAVVTMAVAVVISSAVLSNTDWNGGAIRGTRVPDPTVFGVNVQSVRHPERWATVCVVLLFLAGVAVSNLRRGRSGRRLIAVRNNERAAASLGTSVLSAKLYAFGVSSALAGLGGVLLAFRNTSVDFSQFSPFQSIQIVLLTVIGGLGFIGGGVVAGIGTISGAAEHIIGIQWTIDALFRLILGLLFLVAIVIHPDGVAAHVSQHLVPRIVRGWRRLVPDRFVKAQAREDVVHVSEVVEPVPPRALQVQDLTVRFGGVVALQSVNLHVVPGEILGLIGPNGAGKTTVVDAVSGFLRNYSGTVRLDGAPLDGLSPSQRARLGITRSFQSLELFEDLSVGDNLRVAADDGALKYFARDLFHPSRQDLTGAAAAVVHEFGLSGDLDRMPTELSYAQRRAVAIARAVATQPSVLLLDEPAAGLDHVARRELEHLIRRLAKDWKMAILLIEHDVPMVMRTCDRVTALNFGTEIGTGTPESIRQNDEVLTAYLGGSTRDVTTSPPMPHEGAIQS